MAQNLYQSITNTVTIPSESTVSDAFDADVIDKYEEATVYISPTSSVIGTLILQGNWTGSGTNFSASEWRNCVDKSGNVIQFANDQATFFDIPQAAGFRVSGSEAQSGVTVRFYAGMNVSVKGTF